MINRFSIVLMHSGGIGLAAADVASAMTVAFELFAQEKPRYVKNIKVVVYDLPIVGLFQTSIIQEKGGFVIKQLHQGFLNWGPRTSFEGPPVGFRIRSPER